MKLRPDIHVLPIHDLRDHDETRECWCRPRQERHDRTLMSESTQAALFVTGLFLLLLIAWLIALWDRYFGL